MSIDETIKKQLKLLPKKPGVYYFKDNHGKIIYVGKAGSLSSRVSSYFQKGHEVRIEKLVGEIKKIDYKTTPSVLEALILEANEIKRLNPKYNVKEKDDRSFLYVVFTKDKFSKVQFVRGHELKKLGEKKFKKVFGPYVSATSVRAALKILRKIFAFSNCEPGQKRPCFYYHIKQCPGVCIGEISASDYAKIIHRLGLVFSGKKKTLLSEMKHEMKEKSKQENFEEATKLRNQIFALEHIRDVAVLTKDDVTDYVGRGLAPRHQDAINIFGRIEGYDISNISGVEAVGSMVVFENGESKKSEYKKFKIKTIKGANDVGMLREVLKRRFSHVGRALAPRHEDIEIPNFKHQIPNNFQIQNYKHKTNSSLRTVVMHERVGQGLACPVDPTRGLYGVPRHESWKLPDLILIDGGRGQINVALEILALKHLNIPVIGIAKGFDRKQDQPIFDKKNPELERVVEQYKNLLLQVRDEAHRFAISYHRARMRGRMK